MDSEKYIGLDVHQATIVVAVMDSSGKLVMESILETKAATIEALSGGTKVAVAFGKISKPLGTVEWTVLAENTIPRARHVGQESAPGSFARTSRPRRHSDIGCPTARAPSREIQAA